MHTAPSSDEIQRYVESLKFEVGRFERYLQDSANPEQLNLAAKRIVLCATLMDEVISRSNLEMGDTPRKAAND